MKYFKSRDEYAFGGYHLERESGSAHIEPETIALEVQEQLEALLEQGSFGDITITIEIGK
jgi:hypothetical protein